ncbi:nuclear transport factor 2 family protein [Thalassotalea marina]|uniref:DUF4440 domain-containing protein n=1 Tax=Thalassotalea marina TaxID=1673741 RepID=A0A919BNH2_9GAMM|nr:nuclear transport factor 2 family protein [Thalassotalea marina]GHG00232.1 hypothetical protein GCM10017161_31090 [Thalassotalea marina]
MQLSNLIIVMALILSFTCSAKSSIENELVNRVDELFLAQTSFDPVALDNLLADEFVEISPKGEFDTKPMVLEYYQAKNKTNFIPVIEKSLVNVNYVDNMAHITLKETFKTENSDTALFSMHAIFVLKRVAKEWKFTYAQYTPIVAKER